MCKHEELILEFEKTLGFTTCKEVGCKSNYTLYKIYICKLCGKKIVIEEKVK